MVVAPDEIYVLFFFDLLGFGDSFPTSQRCHVHGHTGEVRHLTEGITVCFCFLLFGLEYKGADIKEKSGEMLLLKGGILLLTSVPRPAPPTGFTFRT